MKNKRLKDIAIALYEALAEAPKEQHQAIMQRSFEMLRIEGLLSRQQTFIEILEKINDTAHNRLRAKIISRHELSSTELKALTDTLKLRYNKEITVENHVDSGFLGGFRIEVGDSILDLSLQAKISKLQNYLLRHA